MSASKQANPTTTRKAHSWADRLPFNLAVLLLSLGATTAARADTILDWNEVLNEAITAQPVGPTEASRIMAMVNTAMYDAVNAIDMRHRSFVYTAAGVSVTASKDAAAAQAARDVLAAMYPARTAVFDGALAATLSQIVDSPDRTSGLQIGAQAANAMLAARSGDGSSAMMTHTVVNQPGHWQPSAPDFSSALTPDWGAVTPFSIASGDQFRPAPPPSLTSAEYTAAFEEVKVYGAKDSALRTADQTQMGIFWAYDVGTIGPPPVLYNQITAVIAHNQQNTLEQNARLFALTNIAQADAGIATWEAKYHHDFWRPIAAIRLADTDGNDATLADPNWEPLGAPGDGIIADFTPPFPAYTSGHAAFGAAVMAMIREFYGTDEIAYHRL